MNKNNKSSSPESVFSLCPRLCHCLGPFESHLEELCARWFGPGLIFLLQFMAIGLMKKAKHQLQDFMLQEKSWPTHRRGFCAPRQPVTIKLLDVKICGPYAPSWAANPNQPTADQIKFFVWSDTLLHQTTCYGYLSSEVE